MQNNGQNNNGYNPNMNSGNYNPNMNNGNYNPNMNNGNYNQNMNNGNYNPNMNNGNYNPNMNNYSKKPSTALGVISLILGILSLCLCVFVFPPFILGIIGIVLGIIQIIKKNGKGLAIAGIITSIISIILAIIMCFALSYIFDSSKGTIIDALSEEMEEYQIESGVYNSKEDRERNENLVYGDWKTKDGVLYSLNKDNSWGWYKNYLDKNDNFYSGTKLTIYRGKKALEKIGKTEQEIKDLDVKSEFKITNLFYIELQPKKAIVNGVDKSSEYGKEVLPVLILIDKNDDNKAILVNTLTYEEFEITRDK